jgi:nucleotide-binding universal stress UspA family protein
LSRNFARILVAVAGCTDPATGKRDNALETIMNRNVRYACELAKHMDSKLALIHIVALPIVVEPRFTPDPEPYREAGRKVLDDARKITSDMGVEAETILETSFGNVAQKIIQVAQEKKFDLITVSSRGHSYLRSLMMGSICDAVTRNAPCPVLVVR